MRTDAENGSRWQRNRLRIVLWSAVVFILLLPLFAMQFTDEVAWDLADFAVAAVLLVGTGLMFELAARMTVDITYRAAFGIALTATLMLVWINLAVGIIGNPHNPANLVYVAVLAVGIIGSLIARFQAHGMALALFTTALAQALVAAIALIIGMQNSEISSLSGVLILNGFFVVMWFVSALLFRRAAHKPMTV